MDKQTLSLQIQEVFTKILSKDINTLNEEDIGFLKARRDYLTEDELEKYAFLFITPKKALSQMNWEELNAEALETGVELKEGEKKKELIERIKQAKQN